MAKKQQLWSLLPPEPEMPNMSMMSPEQTTVPQLPLTPPAATMPMKSITREYKVAMPNASGVPQYEKQFDDAFYASMDERKKALDMLRSKLGQTEENAPSGLNAIDLKPFLMHADNLMGTNQSYAYNGNQQVRDHKDTVQKLQERIDKSENALSDDEMGYLKLKAQEEGMKIRESNMLRAAARASEGEESRVRREYLNNPAIKGMNDVDAAYRSIESNNATTGPAQQAFVFQFTKLLDPGSVVRETEYATSAANAGKINQLYQLASSWSEGKPLTPQQIADMKNVAREIMKSYRQKVDSVNGYYGDLSRRKGFDPRNVIVDTYKPGNMGGPEVKEFNGKKYTLRGDEWVEVK